MKHKRKWLFVHTAIIFMFTIFELFTKAIIYPVRFRYSNILGLLLIIEDSGVALRNERVFYLLLHIDEFPLSLSSASFCRIAWCSSSCRLFQRWCSVNYSSMIKINHQLYGKRTFFRQFNKLDIFFFFLKEKSSNISFLICIQYCIHYYSFLLHSNFIYTYNLISIWIFFNGTHLL